MNARAQPLAPHHTTTPADAAVAPPVPATSLQTRATRAAYALVVLVTGVTAASRAGVVAPDTLAASPRRLAEGKVWLLATNGMLVQRPILLSLLSFALLSLFTLYLCGSRVFAASAAVGHVGSTLLAYLVVTVGFAVDRGSVRSVLDVPDYGVSAMQAAWIGAIAATVWRREGQTARGRVLTVGSCLAVTAFAWMLRSDLTLLDLDHLFAFTIGASFAAAWASPATPPLPRTARAFARRLPTAATNLRTAPPTPWLPLVAASLVALIALANLQSAASPNIRWRGRLVKHLLPHGLPSISHALALPLSAALLLAAVSLARRRYRAWQSALGFLVALGVLDLLKGFSYEQSGMSLVAAVFLYWARPAFVVAPDPRALRSSLNLAAAVLAGTVALAAAATWVSIPGAPSLSLVLRESRALLLWQDGPVRFRHELRHFPLAVNLLSLGGALCAAWALFRPLCAPLLRPTHTSRRRARLLIRVYGRDTLAFFKLRQDAQYLFSPDRQAFLGYRIERNVLLVSGDPVGNPASIPALLTETCRFAARHGLRLGVLGASEALLPIYRHAGLRAFYLGDEAILDTRSFSLAGRAIRKVRQSVNRLDRLGYQAELVLARDLDDTDLAELRHVAAAHLGGIPERGFSMAMDTLRSDDTAEAHIAIARDRSGRIAGFLHYVPSYGRAAVSLAAMRRRPEQPNGLTEYLVSRSIALLREQGIEEVSLNFSLLGRYLRQPANPAQRLLAACLRRLGRWFQIESLYRFNAKFFPRWEPRYLVYQGAFGLLPTALASLWIEGQIPHIPRSRRQRTAHADTAKVFH
jgi:lysyl-tRNA synthetase, class II